jgi:thioredoxin reductase
VLVCDAGAPRNRHSRALHGYLTRDGVAPAAFIAAGCEELGRYGVTFRRGSVTHACISADGSGFDVAFDSGSAEQGKYLLIATGVADEVPDVPGLAACYGRSVFHCPYCDGWEWRDRRLAVLADGVAGARLALSLKTWSAEVVLLSDRDNARRLSRAWRTRLTENQIDSRRARVAALHHSEGLLREVELATGERLPCDALFFAAPQHPQSPLAVSLGCAVNRKGTVATSALSHTNVPGVFVAGDASHDAQYVVVAAAEGFKAGLAINQALQKRHSGHE